MNLKKFVEALQSDIDASAVNRGFDILDIKCSNNVIQVIADKPGGITLDECAQLSRVIEEILEAHDNQISVKYSLEISSPGLFRPLTKEKHYRQVIGQTIRVELVNTMEGRRRYSGILEALTDRGTLKLRTETEETFEFDIEDIRQASLNPSIDLES